MRSSNFLPRAKYPARPVLRLRERYATADSQSDIRIQLYWYLCEWGRQSPIHHALVPLNCPFFMLSSFYNGTISALANAATLGTRPLAHLGHNAARQAMLGLWLQSHAVYQSWCSAFQSSSPSPLKLLTTPPLGVPAIVMRRTVSRGRDHSPGANRVDFLGTGRNGPIFHRFWLLRVAQRLWG